MRNMAHFLDGAVPVPGIMNTRTAPSPSSRRPEGAWRSSCWIASLPLVTCNDGCIVSRSLDSWYWSNFLPMSGRCRDPRRTLIGNSNEIDGSRRPMSPWRTLQGPYKNHAGSTKIRAWCTRHERRRPPSNRGEPRAVGDRRSVRGLDGAVPGHNSNRRAAPERNLRIAPGFLPKSAKKTRSPCL